MRDVLIIGASGGIGRALASAHRARGDKVTPLSRSKDGFDITDERAVARHLEALGPFDRVIMATGALEVDGAKPEKTIKALSATGMSDQFAVNAIGPALVLSHAHRLLPRDRPGLFVALSARVGSIEDNRLGGWVSYRAAKAALNQIMHTVAIELARTHKQASVVALHPGTVETDFTRAYLARHPAVAPDLAAARLLDTMDSLNAAHTGQFFDYAGVRIPW